MENDFYLDEAWLAAYFEKDWFDKVIEIGSPDLSIFDYPEFDPTLLYSDYHERFVDLVSKALASSQIQPTRLLEIGSSLGRTFFEICTKVKSVNNATLVEPSQNLFRGFKMIFENGEERRFKVLRGNKGFAGLEVDFHEIRQRCDHVSRVLINRPYEALSDEIGDYDLVLCSNVLDQCRHPRELVEHLKRRTRRGGVLALTCTYQWNSKYIDNPGQMISNINELFGESWEMLAEGNLEFKCRRAERHWLTFLSHAAIFKKS